MAWKDLIPGCFGVDDLEFALHILDADKAMAMYTAAVEDGAYMHDVLMETKAFLVSKNATMEHIDEQLEKVAKLQI